MRNITACLIFYVVLIVSNEAYPWGVATHESLSEYAVENSAIGVCNSITTKKCGYLNDFLGFSNGLTTKISYGENKEIVKWLRSGSNLEDTRPRYVNHFHDPMWSMGEWDKAGLKSPLGDSSPLWAQDSLGQTFLPVPFWDQYLESASERDWSWPKVREYFYTALTSSGDAERQEYFARTHLDAVFHQMY